MAVRYTPCPVLKIRHWQYGIVQCILICTCELLPCNCRCKHNTGNLCFLTFVNGEAVRCCFSRNDLGDELDTTILTKLLCYMNLSDMISRSRRAKSVREACCKTWYANSMKWQAFRLINKIHVQCWQNLLMNIYTLPIFTLYYFLC